MSDDDTDVRSPAEREALDAWAPLPPPAGFADRVLAARSAPPTPVRRRRWPIIVAAAATACAAAATAAVVMRGEPDLSASGSLHADRRTTEQLGERAVAVAEPAASLTWSVDHGGATDVVQQRGDVFYRVDKTGAPFIVHTPAGDVRVTGTCFRISIQSPEEAMTKTKQILLSGTLGAAVATAVVVTVYEGHVIAETKTARTEIAAGNRATIATDSGTVVASADPSTVAGGAPKPGGGPIMIRKAPPPAIDTAKASREELVAYAQAQQAENAKLRGLLAQLESGPPRGADDENPDGRPFYDPSPETLKQWAKDCRVQSDEPGFDRWEPQTDLGRNERGLEPGELAAYNDALSEVKKEWTTFVRLLYIEATGDAAGAETLSLQAMGNEILEKSGDQSGEVLKQLSAERAGLQPVGDPTREPPATRYMRELTKLGDKTEAALAKRLGPERARAIRGDGWGARSRMQGCPSTGAEEPSEP